MRARDVYNYDNAVFASLREPAREVVAAYQTAARFLDTVQESLLIEHGMVFTAQLIHNLAHKMPKRFDKFGDMLHERHLMVEYPATPELVERIEEPEKGFEIVIGVLDDVQEALEKFRNAAETPMLRPMAIAAEDLMLKNSRDYTMILELWTMWDSSNSKTSFDSWAKKLGKHRGVDDE